MLRSDDDVAFISLEEIKCVKSSQAVLHHTAYIHLALLGYRTKAKVNAASRQSTSRSKPSPALSSSKSKLTKSTHPSWPQAGAVSTRSSTISSSSKAHHPLASEPSNEEIDLTLRPNITSFSPSSQGLPSKPLLLGQATDPKSNNPPLSFLASTNRSDIPSSTLLSFSSKSALALAPIGLGGAPPSPRSEPKHSSVSTHPPQPAKVNANADRPVPKNCKISIVAQKPDFGRIRQSSFIFLP